MKSDIDWSGVDAAIRAREHGRCVIGMTAVAPSGSRFDHNPDRQFVAASTVKIPIMVRLYEEIEAGTRSLADPWRMREADKAPGSGVMLHLHDGMGFTLADLAYLMMSISDNTATNVLIDMLGMAPVNATMQRLGMTRSTLGRKMMGRAAEGTEEENWATSADYAGAIAALLEDRAGTPDSCRQMVALLEKQQNDRRIARFLPKVDRPRWGTKTGSVTGVCNDVGFVFGAGGPVILSVFCEWPPDAHAGEEIIGEVCAAALRATGVLKA